MKVNLANKKKYVIGVVILGLAVAGTVVRFRKAKDKPAGSFVTTSTVEKQEILKTLSLKAPLEGTESAEIVSNLHYEVKSLNVKEGDVVKKGQILAILDSESLEKDIRKAEDELQLQVLRDQEANRDEKLALQKAQTSLEETLEDKQRQYDAAVAKLDTEKRNYENKKQLLDAGAASQEELNQAKDTYDDAQRAVEGFEVKNGKVVASKSELQGVQSVQATDAASRQKSLEIAKTDLARKKQDLEDCEIKSPIDGTITRVNIKMGRFADETDEDKPMFEVEDINKLQMKVLVSEYDIDQVKVGQKVEITANLLGDKKVEGVVSRISPTGEAKTGTSERFIPAVVDVKEKDCGLIAGINAQAKIIVQDCKDALVVPIECLVEQEGGKTQVLRVNAQNKLEAIDVKLGVENDLNVQVFSDKLKKGDKVILSPTPDLKDGSEVMTSQV